MSITNFGKIFQICNNIMSYRFSIFGVSVTLWTLLLFSLLVTLVLYTVYKLFSIE